MLASEMSSELPEQLSFPKGRDFDFAVPDHKTRIVLRETAQLTPHPRNKAIYGEEDVSDLVDHMRHFEWVKPLVCTSNNTIISGHRRWKAAIELGIESIPVEVRKFSDETAELEALLLENASRVKTTEQKVREADAWLDIEKHYAKQRKQQAAATTNQKLGRTSETTLQENFPEASKGQTRDAVAHRVGLGSGRTFEKGAAVARKIDSLKKDAPEAALALSKALEESVDFAHKLHKKSPQECQTIGRLIANGKAKSTKQAAQMLRKNNFTTCGGFSVGDLVAVNNIESNYIGWEGEVGQLWEAEQQISVNFEGGASQIKFYPYELDLIAKASASIAFRIGDFAFVDIDRHEAVSSQEKKWNHFWGKIAQIGEKGDLTVDFGSENLQLFSHDLKLVDTPSAEFSQVAERVLQLRTLDLDEIEQSLLNVFQRRKLFMSRHVNYLDFVGNFYLSDGVAEVV